MENEILLQIAQEYQAPLYVYQASKIENQYHRLLKAFSKIERLQINYAVKGFI